MTETGPFSRPFDLAALQRQRGPIHIEATPDERKAIAEEFKLLALDSLVAEFEIAPAMGEAFELTGRVRSSLVQSCVVSLAPVPQTLDEAMVLDLVPAGSPAAETEETDDRDPPAVYEDGSVDLGSIALEYFALGLDPYPRAPGAVLPAEANADQPSGPFAALGKLSTGAPKRGTS
jgi:uncharacterized metal-binding protein YceD (DUF177 family)